ncbi:EsaB/YukD family protein [Candidatus Nitrosotenuis aquarius]|uniref:EsaB/YukD family protein n=1 Tax=Candidatus Nitrosotenuis aquarius TaxID=1846278 RepID=UPI000C1E9202|nr:EsaB/YukD family protein [Candidatus Nitrosotenuis aquarius]
MAEEKKKNDNELTITIQTTKGAWKDAVFQKTAKISEVISAVIEHFSFSKDGKYQLNPENEPDKPFDPKRPLVSYGIKDGDILVFTDLGVAV